MVLNIQNRLSQAKNLDKEINELTEALRCPFEYKRYADRSFNYALYCEMINRRIDKLQAIRQEAETIINMIADSTLRQLLIMRYLHDYTWESISLKINYCYKHTVERLHKKALKEAAAMKENDKQRKKRL